MSKKPVVLAVDVGFSNTKAVWGVGNSSESEIIYRSYAKSTLHDHIAFWQFKANLNRVAIPIDDLYYLVGPDVNLAGVVPMFRTDLIARPEYLSLLRGAMYYMTEANGFFADIDCLVVGLPVCNFLSSREELVRVCKGVHTIPTPQALILQYGPYIAINVKSVLVLPNPMSSLILASTPYSGLSNFEKDGVVLAIDAGYKSYGWVVAKDGIMDFESSSNLDSGMPHVLFKIANQVSLDLGISVSDCYLECEKAIDSGMLEVYGQKYDFTWYKKEYIDGIVEDNVNRFYPFVSEFDRLIKCIILTGGRAKHYKKAVQDRFKGHEVIIIKNPVMSNARGLYLWAFDETH